MQFALLIVGAWVAGLAIVLLVGITQPARPAAHGVDMTSPSSDVTREIAGRRWSGEPVAVVRVEGRRWWSDPVAAAEIAGRRWG